MTTHNIKVTQYNLYPDWVSAGTRGSYGSARLQFEFSPEWEGTDRRVSFYPADGTAPVSLAVDKDGGVTVPSELMAASGTGKYVIDGIKAGVREISLCGFLRVYDTLTPSDSPAGEPTPSEYIQLRAELNELRALIASLHENDGELVSFTLDGEVITAQKGMTWQDIYERGEYPEGLFYIEADTVEGQQGSVYDDTLGIDESGEPYYVAPNYLPINGHRYLSMW